MSTAVLAPDLGVVKERQRAVWSSGDYAILGATIQIIGERLCEAAEIRAGSKVLDVAAGNGNATLAAARRFAHVTSTDYVPALLERGRERAAADRLAATFQEADAEALPFRDGEFDAALSTVGVMFTPNQEKAAAEMLRVVRKGGTIGLANWTPEGFVGQLLKIVSRRLPPPPPGLRPATAWGTETRLAELFPGQKIRADRRNFTFCYESPRHWLEVFRAYYGPVNRAFGSLDANGRAALEGEILALLETSNRSGDETLLVPGEYLEVVMTKE